MKYGRRQLIGRLGESLAATFLQNLGYTILDRNYRTPYGEIDLVASQESSIVFVEVKSRSSSSMGPPEISITHRKADHMRSAAEYYFQHHPEMSNNWRIDVIAVQLKPGNSPAQIDHFENVIS